MELRSQGTALAICFVSLDYPSGRSGGGVGTVVQTLARWLVAEGHRVSVVAMADRQVREVDGGVDVRRFAAGTLHRRIMHIPTLWRLSRAVGEIEQSWRAFQTVRALRAEGVPDVVEITETGGLFSAMLLRGSVVIARLHGEGYTFYKHAPDVRLGFDVRLRRVIQRIALRRARLLVAPSAAHAREIEGELKSPTPVFVVPNAVSATESVELDDTTSAHDQPIVLYVGRLDWVKGVPLLLRAAKDVVKACPGVTFVLAGGGHHTLRPETLENLIRSCELENAVRRLGHVRREDLAAWYRRATVCVVPSYYETFGLSALEAMTFGCAVVASQAGALPELIEHERTGLLVSPGDPRALTSAIVRLLGDAELRSRLGAEAQRRSRALFDVRDVGHRNVEIYRLASGLAGR